MIGLSKTVVSMSIMSASITELRLRCSKTCSSMIKVPSLPRRFRNRQSVEGFKKVVVFQKWRWPWLHCPSKGIAVDKQAQDDIMHLGRFRKADGLAGQAFNTRP